MNLYRKSSLILGGILAAFPAGAQGLDAEKHGESLVQRWCVSCHLPGNVASGSDAAPTLRQIRDLARKDPEHIRTFLSRPHSPMPPLQLSRADIGDVVAYLRSAE